VPKRWARSLTRTRPSRLMMSRTTRRRSSFNMCCMATQRNPDLGVRLGPARLTFAFHLILLLSKVKGKIPGPLSASDQCAASSQLYSRDARPRRKLLPARPRVAFGWKGVRAIETSHSFPGRYAAEALPWQVRGFLDLHGASRLPSAAPGNKLARGDMDSSSTPGPGRQSRNGRRFN